MKKSFPSIVMAFLTPSIVLFAGNGCSGCKGCNKPPEDPPEMPSAAVTSAPPVLTIEVPDAGDDGDADADADASKGGGSPPSLSGLRACCKALETNAASAVPPQNTWLVGAAQYCNATVASVSSPTQKDAMLKQLGVMLRGSTLPASCK